MKISRDLTGQILNRFAIVFPLPTPYQPELIDIWHSMVCEFEANDVLEASRRLMAKLTRFPFPADFIEELNSKAA